MLAMTSILSSLVKIAKPSSMIAAPRLFTTCIIIPRNTSLNMKDSLMSCVKLLQPVTPLVNQVCGFKVKGRLRRRCSSCYFVVRQERLYVICPKHPRHKQMAMKPKPHNTWILTHASQSPVRPW